jgi:hypothetical protein
MEVHMRSRIIAVVGMLAVSASIFAYAQPNPSVQGVWRVSEATAPDGTAIKNPQPGLYVFTKRHYSIVLVRGTSERTEPPAAADPAKLTDAEKIARYEAWRSFVANAGTYEVSGGTLNMTPIVAKNPALMGPSATRPATSFTLTGKTLTITQKSADGKSETKVVLTRLE